MKTLWTCTEPYLHSINVRVRYYTSHVLFFLFRNGASFKKVKENMHSVDLFLSTFQ